MIRRPIQKTTAVFLGIFSVAVLLGGYSWISHRQHLENPNDTTIPTWSQIKTGIDSILEIDEWTEESWIVSDSKASGARFFLGLAFGISGAFVIGMLMGCFSPAEAFFYPPLSLLAKIPPTGALAVFFVLVGMDMSMFVTMIAFGILPTLALSIFLAVKEFPEELQYKAYTLGASHSEVVWTILFRFVLPKLLDAVRLMIGPALVYLIAAEMVVGDVGFGYRIRLQSKLLDMSVVYPYLALLAAFGFAMDYGLRLLQRKLCPWFEKHRG